MPKVTKEKKSKPLRHNPLAEEIMEHADKAGLRKVPRNKLKGSATADSDEEGENQVPAAVTQKVIEMAQAQKATEDDDGWQDDEMNVASHQDVEVEEVVDVEVDEEGFVVAPITTDEEERALAMFLPSKSAQTAGHTLGDVILQKIQEAEARAQSREEQEQGEAGGGLSPKVIQVYSEIGKWMKDYKSGKLPKAFKVIPSLTNWEEVLSLTSPLTWSPGAMYEAVSIFSSNLNPRMAQRFYNLVLLPAIRQDIQTHKKLNFHYFRSLKKALFKPAAFFKGIVLPLASESCTLREVVILSSVLSKTTVPAMHVAATLVRLCVMSPWYGTTSVLMAALINKKYNLPLQVIEGLVAHFCAFVSEEQALPLVWHRALLVFVQRYKFELNEDQKYRLKELLKVHWHEAVSSEVRREMVAPKPGELVPTAASMDVS